MKRKEKLSSKLLRSPYITRPLSLLARGFITLLWWTLRVEVEGEKELQDYAKRQNTDDDFSSIIIALWHNRLFLIANLMRKILPVVRITALISKSRDGEVPTLFAKTYKDVDVIRVGHRSRNVALLQTIEALNEKRIVIITPDGPKGPVHTVKPGIIFSAAKSKAVIFPLSWKATWSFCFNSWDRFCIPLPFSKVTVTLGKPLAIKETTSIEDGQLALEQALQKD